MDNSNDSSNRSILESETPNFRAALRLLADGEMSHRERGSLLSRLPDDSPHWREIALAFVEQQILNESLVKNRLGTGATRLVPCSESLRPQCLDTAGFRKSRSYKWTWLAAVSACLLFGFVLGQSWSNLEMRSSPSLVEADSIPSDKGNQETGLEVLPDQVARHLSETLNRSGGPIPLAIRREMMRCGYVIIEQDRLSTIQLPGGKTLELPVRSVAVTYLGNSAYQ